MYRFPEGLFTEVRIEKTEDNYYFVKNGEVEGNGRNAVTVNLFLDCIEIVCHTSIPLPTVEYPDFHTGYSI